MFQIKTTLKHSVEYPKFDLMFENIKFSTLESNFIGFHQSQLQAILPKKGSHFEKKKMKKFMKIYVLDIPKYSFIINEFKKKEIYHITYIHATYH
jgi:hypothetical protein